MSTAREIEAKLKATAPVIGAFASAVNVSIERVVHDLEYLSNGREVCAKRARKLRRRGDQVRFVGSTTTGKARYRWLPGKWTLALKVEGLG